MVIDHLLFNIDTTRHFQAGPGKPAVNANVIDKNGTTNLNSITLNRWLFCYVHWFLER